MQDPLRGCPPLSPPDYRVSMETGCAIHTTTA
jgi:hypothetical protein